jgi:phospholipid transport system substrate-binding protein
MAQHALGDTYNDLNEETKEEFVSLFATIIRDNSLNRLDIYRAEVKYDDIMVRGDTADVETTAQLEDVRTSVDYDLRIIDSEWMITDMWIDGVSTADSYQRQFQSIIRKRGFDALMESLRKRAARSTT